jgi:SAM-dependent methyltransferase
MRVRPMPPSVIDKQNADFWNELCGTWLARALGITELSPENLRRFDESYMNYYTYLGRYVYPENLTGKRVLEIGLGYGTLGQVLASKDCRYYGLDIAKNPVALMNYRFALQGLAGDFRVGSVLDLPYKEAAFDYVYSIGCLHHTGDLRRAVGEVYRVLTDGGKAVIMLYNRHSFRRLIFLPIVHLRNLLSGRSTERASFSDWARTWYDKDAKGEAAPHTDYVSRAQVRRLFKAYRTVRIESQNFDSLVLKGRLLVPRERFLSNLARVMGLDLYITATK